MCLFYYGERNVAFLLAFAFFSQCVIGKPSTQCVNDPSRQKNGSGFGDIFAD